MSLTKLTWDMMQARSTSRCYKTGGCAGSAWEDRPNKSGTTLTAPLVRSLVANGAQWDRQGASISSGYRYDPAEQGNCKNIDEVSALSLVLILMMCNLPSRFSRVISFSWRSMRNYDLASAVLESLQWRQLQTVHPSRHPQCKKKNGREPLSWSDGLFGSLDSIGFYRI